MLKHTVSVDFCPLLNIIFTETNSILITMDFYVPRLYGSLNAMNSRPVTLHCSEECYLCKCTHCKGLKYIIRPQFLSKERIFWSDNHVEGTDESVISCVQRCPHCGNYYYIELANTPKCNVKGVSSGTMRLDELETVLADSRFMRSLDNDSRAAVIMQYVHTYNNLYRRNAVMRLTASYSQARCFTEMIISLAGNCSVPKIVLADLYRQAGMFRRSMEYIADNLSSIAVDDNAYETVDTIRYLAVKGDANPFITRREKLE